MVPRCNITKRLHFGFLHQQAAAIATAPGGTADVRSADGERRLAKASRIQFATISCRWFHDTPVVWLVYGEDTGTAPTFNCWASIARC